MKPKAYILVGIPGSGKTTWYEGRSWPENTVYISTDTHVERYAKENGKTYSEVFVEYMPTAIKLMVEDVIRARQSSMDIVWDQTSTSIASRAKKFEMLPGYEMIAVVFSIPEPEELKIRLNRPGKDIPSEVIHKMIELFHPPCIEEGFDELIYP